MERVVDPAQSNLRRAPAVIGIDPFDSTISHEIHIYRPIHSRSRAGHRADQEGPKAHDSPSGLGTSAAPMRGSEWRILQGNPERGDRCVNQGDPTVKTYPEICPYSVIMHRTQSNSWNRIVPKQPRFGSNIAFGVL